jgi:chaperonin GroES
MNIKAKHDRVIIQPLQETESQYGSIIIPDLGKERPVKGEVVSVGPGRRTEHGNIVKPTCSVGDIVLIPQFGAQVVSEDNIDYYITRDSEVLAVYLKEEKNNEV